MLSSFFVGKRNVAVRSRHLLMSPLSDLTLRQKPVGGSSPCEKGRGDPRSRGRPKRRSRGARWLDPASAMPSRIFSQTPGTPLFRHSLCTLLSLFFFLPGLHTTDDVSEGLASKTLNILRNSKSYMPAPVSPKK